MAFNFNDFITGIGDAITDPNVIGALGGAIIGAQDGEVTQAQRPFFYDGQEQSVVDLLGMANQEYDAGPQQYFPDDTVAALDQNLIAGQNRALGAVGRQQQLADVGALAAGELAAGGAGRVEGFNLPEQIGFGIDPGLEAATLNPVMRELQNRVLPGISQSATSQGAFGGTRMANMQQSAVNSAAERGTEALARANLEARGQSITQRAGDVDDMLTGRNQDIQQNQLYNQALQSGITGTSSAIGTQLQPAQTLMDIGSQRTGYEQELINADVDRFNFNQQAPIDALTRLGQRLTMNFPGGSTTTATRPANIGTILGGALTGLQLGNSFLQGGGGGGGTSGGPGSVGMLYDPNFNVANM